jgi:hypothetical protein
MDVIYCVRLYPDKTDCYFIAFFIRLVGVKQMNLLIHGCFVLGRTCLRLVGCINFLFPSDHHFLKPLSTTPPPFVYLPIYH